MPDKLLNYEFAANGGGEEVGFNEAVVTNFKGHLSYHLARESIQNIIDAAVNFPAKADFQLFRWKAKDIPEYEELIEIFKSCRDYFNNNPQSVDFFKIAIEKLEKNQSLPVLRISDYNTRGLTGGDDDINGDYYNFLKSSGASSKRSGSGGSFGLGKGAYFAASSLHTIFVSSIYGKDKCVFQGKLRLVTHVRNGVKSQHTGSFGLAGQKPVRSPELIPELFRRKEQGTDIYIVGFYEDEGWDEQIIKSVLNNFWLAVLWSKLEARVGNLTIDRNNIRKLMFKYFSEDENDTEENPNPLPVFLAYTDEFNHKKFGEDKEGVLPTLGHVMLYVLLKENFYKKISYFRLTGMEIQKRLHHVPLGYAGVFICDDEKGNEILRMMENPQHNKWEAENAREKTAEMFEKAKKAEKEIKEFIRKSLKSLFEARGSESLNIPGLEKYLFSTEEDEEKFSGNMISGDSASVVSTKETGSEIGAESEESGVEIVKPIKVINESTENIKNGTRKVTRRGGGGGGVSDLPQIGGETGGNIKGSILTDIEIRSFAVKKEDDSVEHIIIVKGEPELKFNLVLAVGTEESFEEIDIVRVIDEKNRQIGSKNNRIYDLQLNEKGSIKLTVSFGTNERYALHMTAYENR
jgi:hypothetical protein